MVIEGLANSNIPVGEFNSGCGYFTNAPKCKAYDSNHVPNAHNSNIFLSGDTYRLILFD
jgi:hypothetical protein